MKKVLILSVLLVAVACLPAFATTYNLNWTENFESTSTGHLTGQNGWFAPDGSYADTDMLVTTNQNHTAGGSKSATQIVSTTLYSSQANSMKARSMSGNYFKDGFAKFWVYEPGTAGNLAAGPQLRVGVYGDGGVTTGGASGGVGIGNNMWTANMSGTVTGFWRAQWSSDVRTMDGTTGITNSNYKWIPYKSAPRRATAGWSYVIITWNMDVNMGTGFAEWRINSTTPNLRVEFDSTAAAGGNRWNLTLPVEGIFIGDATVKTQTAGLEGNVDDIEFHGNVVPEPTSVLALGTGLIGLLGLIRRKR